MLMFRLKRPKIHISNNIKNLHIQNWVPNSHLQRIIMVKQVSWYGHILVL